MKNDLLILLKKIDALEKHVVREDLIRVKRDLKSLRLQIKKMIVSEK